MPASAHLTATLSPKTLQSTFGSNIQHFQISGLLFLNLESMSYLDESALKCFGGPILDSRFKIGVLGILNLEP